MKLENHTVDELYILHEVGYCEIKVLYKGFWFESVAETFDTAYWGMVRQLDTTVIVEYPVNPYREW